MTRRGDALGPLPTGDSATPPQGGTGVSGRGEKKYAINEIFYSLQGEGARAGTANVFVRFAGCNLTCREKDEASGFDCDTEFTSHERMTAEEIWEKCMAITPVISPGDGKFFNVIFTGGEPALQLDAELMERFAGCYKAIETNGTKALPNDLDWVCVSPKTAEHTLVRSWRSPDEVKYVRHHGQPIPQPMLASGFKFISPRFGADGKVDRDDLEWCIDLVKQHPSWRLSVQQHKLWGIR
jgi:organic radical activating enzyme